jgi:hypothetical protein
MYDPDKPELMTPLERAALDRDHAARLHAHTHPENESKAMHSAVKALVGLASHVQHMIDRKHFHALCNALEDARVNVRGFKEKHPQVSEVLVSLADLVVEHEAETAPLLKNAHPFFGPIAAHDCHCKRCCLERHAADSGDHFSA